MDHGRAIDDLLDGTSNSFQSLACQANQSSNDILHYGQAMKAKDSEDFKLAMKKGVNDLYEAEVYDVIPTSENPKDRKLIKFI